MLALWSGESDVASQHCFQSMSTAYAQTLTICVHSTARVICNAMSIYMCYNMCIIYMYMHVHVVA